MARVARKRLYIAPETAYAQSPRPADSAYLSLVPSETLDGSGGKQGIESARFTGRTGPTRQIPGAGLGALTWGMEMLGLATQAGAGVSPVAQDWWDLVMRGIFNASPIERDGVAVVSHVGTALDLGAANDLYDVGDLICLVDAAGEVRWARIATDNADGSYVLSYAPQVGPAGSLTNMVATVARGSRVWRDEDGRDTSITLAGLFDQDQTFWRECPGIRVNAASFEVTPNALALWSIGAQSDDFIPMDGNGGRPSAPSGLSDAVNGDPAVTATTPLIAARVYLDGVPLTESATISGDLGISPLERPDTGNLQGRSNVKQLEQVPVITVTSPYSDDLAVLHRSRGSRELMLELGTGGDSVAINIPVAQPIEHGPADTNGELDATVQFRATTEGTFPRVQLGRS